MKQIEYIVTCTYDDKKVFSKAYHGELIRCINCRYHEEVLRPEGDHNFIDDMCTVSGLPVNGCDYCSKGRRKV